MLDFPVRGLCMLHNSGGGGMTPKHVQGKKTVPLFFIVWSSEEKMKPYKWDIGKQREVI
jgi:hypothetical protein